jgi:hypothetical protein
MVAKGSAPYVGDDEIALQIRFSPMPPEVSGPAIHNLMKTMHGLTDNASNILTYQLLGFLSTMRCATESSHVITLGVIYRYMA